jgi:hypothetical protein
MNVAAGEQTQRYKREGTMKSIPILVIVIQREDHFTKAPKPRRGLAANERKMSANL